MSADSVGASPVAPDAAPDDTESVPTRRRIPLPQQLPLLVGLVLLWMALWGSVSVLTILTGIVIALLVTRAFYLPPVELGRRVNPLWAIVFLLRFFGELVVASFQVAGLAFTPRAIRRSAVVRVPLHTRSDLIMTLTAIAISLVPGSLVLEVDRRNAILYVHVLGASTADEVEAAKRHTLSIERLIIASIGSAAEWKQVR